MPPLPKRRTSKARQGERRQHLGIVAPALDVCPQCHSPKPAYRACPVCGTYAGRQVIEIKTPKKKTEQ